MHVDVLVSEYVMVNEEMAHAEQLRGGDDGFWVGK